MAYCYLTRCAVQPFETLFFILFHRKQPLNHGERLYPMECEVNLCRTPIALPAGSSHHIATGGSRLESATQRTISALRTSQQLHLNALAKRSHNNNNIAVKWTERSDDYTNADVAIVSHIGCPSYIFFLAQYVELAGRRRWHRRVKD